MQFSWDEQSVGWFLDASAYTGYHKALAKKIIPYLEPGDTVLDAGCGLGRLDIELAGHVSAITAVDIDECVTKALKRDIKDLGISNMLVHHGDVTELSGVFNVVIMSFFGHVDVKEFFGRFRRRLIRIVGAENKSFLYPEKHRRYIKKTVPDIQEEFAGMGISYILELCSIEFGQPLVSLKDAGQYVLKIAPEAETDEIKRFLDDNLISTDREDYPYYLPYKKELGIFIVDKEGIA